MNISTWKYDDDWCGCMQVKTEENANDMERTRNEEE